MLCAQDTIKDNVAINPARPMTRPRRSSSAQTVSALTRHVYVAPTGGRAKELAPAPITSTLTSFLEDDQINLT